MKKIKVLQLSDKKDFETVVSEFINNVSNLINIDYFVNKIQVDNNYEFVYTAIIEYED